MYSTSRLRVDQSRKKEMKKGSKLVAKRRSMRRRSHSTARTEYKCTNKRRTTPLSLGSILSQDTAEEGLDGGKMVSGFRFIFINGTQLPPMNVTLRQFDNEFFDVIARKSRDHVTSHDRGNLGDDDVFWFLVFGQTTRRVIHRPRTIIHP